MHPSFVARIEREVRDAERVRVFGAAVGKALLVAEEQQHPAPGEVQHPVRRLGGRHLGQVHLRYERQRPPRPYFVAVAPAGARAPPGPGKALPNQRHAAKAGARARLAAHLKDFGKRRVPGEHLARIGGAPRRVFRHQPQARPRQVRHRLGHAPQPRLLGPEPYLLAVRRAPVIHVSLALLLEALLCADSSRRV